MSKFGDFLKSVKEKDMEFFFKGGHKMVSNQYFTFTHYISEDEVIVCTNNVKVINGNYVLIVDNNKGVYLKDWQVRELKNWDIGAETFCVKLNRNFFKPYTFKFNFENFSFEKEETFDDMVSTAKEQDTTNIKWAFGRFAA